MEKEILIPYTPRGWQKEAEKILNRFTVLVMHRRAGKTVFDVNMLIKKVLSCKKPHPQVAYIAPTREQAKKIAWESASGFKTFLANFNSFINYNEAELRIDLPNGGKIYLLGSENKDSIRGMYFDFVVLDEYQDMPDDYLDKVVAPTLMDRQGSCIITGTPKGKNRLFEAYKMALSKDHPDWSGFLRTVQDTDILNVEDLEAAKARGEEAYEQEYNCSFDAAIRGAFFGKQIEKLIYQKRIIDKEYDPGYPVVAAMDIGFDGTGIWYLQKIGDQPLVIDFDYMENKDIPQIANLMMGKDYVYTYIILPHDGTKRSITDKTKTAVGQFKKLGFKVVVAMKLPLVDAISAGRNLLDRVQFTKRCFELNFKFGKGKTTPLDALSLYRAEYNEEEGVQRTAEKHDRASHIGSAWRTLAVGLKLTGSMDGFDIQNIHTPMRPKKPAKAKTTWSKFNKRFKR